MAEDRGGGGGGGPHTLDSSDHTDIPEITEAAGATLEHDGSNWVGVTTWASAKGIADDVILGIGSDSDTVLFHRSTALSADAELSNVIVGTSNHQGVAANSLVLSNITTDGDIIILVSDGGNSKEVLLADADVAFLHLGFGMINTSLYSSGNMIFATGGVAVLGTGEGAGTAATGTTFRAPDLVTGGAGNVAGADLTLAAGLGTGTGDVGTIIFSLPIVAAAGDNLQTTAARLTMDMIAATSTLTLTFAQEVSLITASGDINFSAASQNIFTTQGRVLDDIKFTFGSNDDTGFRHFALGLDADEGVTSFILGSEVHQAVANDSLVISNKTVDGDMMFLVADSGPNSFEFLHADGSAATVTVGHGMSATIIKTNSGDVTVNAAGSFNVTLTAGDADAFDMNDGTSSYYLMSTVIDQSGVIAHRFVNTNVSFANVASSSFTQMALSAYTLNVTTDADDITGTFPTMLSIGTATLTSATASTNYTDVISSVSIEAPQAGLNVILDHAAALHILNGQGGGAGTATIQSGIYIDDQIGGGTSDYGIFIAGADTAAIWVNSADPIHVGFAGAGTGKMEWAGTTSGVVTLTVAAAAGTWTMVLPAAVGGAGEQLTDAGANGITSWAAASSLSMYKDIGGYLAPADALDKILGTRVALFNYRRPEIDGPKMMNTGDFDTLYAGVLGEEFPEVMHFEGNIFSPVSAFGYTVGAIQAQQDEIAELKIRIEELERLGA